MANAGKRIIFNLFERALSADWNRVQAFQEAGAAEVLRALYNDRRWQFTYPGLHVPVTALEAPLSAQVLSGLMVRPNLAASLLIDAGIAIVLVPGGTADDSALTTVIDPGVQAAGVLNFTANGGGGTRIDYVECQMVDTVLETATRDIWDVPTEQFNPALVDKVKAARLTYRIRVGVPGGGSPGPVAGWLPLAVIAVQPGATGFTQCDVWDVRPLVSDLVEGGEQHKDPVGAVSSSNGVGRTDMRLDLGFVAGSPVIHGFAASAFDGYRAGGPIRRSSASSIANFGSTVFPNGGDVAAGLAIGIAENQGSGFALTEGIVYLVAAFPDGLPRWVRYSQANDVVVGGRVPKGPRGILFVTKTAPSAWGSYAGSGNTVQPPTICGFTVASDRAVVLAAFLINGAPQFDQGTGFKNSVLHVRSTPHTAIATTSVLPLVAPDPLVFDLSTANAFIPRHTMAVIVDLSCGVDYTGTGEALIRVSAGTTHGTDEFFIETFTMFPAVALNQAFGARVRIPFLSPAFGSNGFSSMKVFVSSNQIAQFETQGSIFVRGWELW